MSRTWPRTTSIAWDGPPVRRRVAAPSRCCHPRRKATSGRASARSGPASRASRCRASITGLVRRSAWRFRSLSVSRTSGALADDGEVVGGSEEPLEVIGVVFVEQARQIDGPRRRFQRTKDARKRFDLETHRPELPRLRMLPQLIASHWRHRFLFLERSRCIPRRDDGQRRYVLRARPPLGAWAGGCAAFAARSCLSFASRRRRARRRSRRTAWLGLEWEWLIRTPPLMDLGRRPPALPAPEARRRGAVGNDAP